MLVWSLDSFYYDDDGDWRWQRQQWWWWRWQGEVFVATKSSLGVVANNRRIRPPQEFQAFDCCFPSVLFKAASLSNDMLCIILATQSLPTVQLFLALAGRGGWDGLILSCDDNGNDHTLFIVCLFVFLNNLLHSSSGNQADVAPSLHLPRICIFVCAIFYLLCICICVFVYLCICVFMYLCIFVFVYYLCICIWVFALLWVIQYRCALFLFCYALFPIVWAMFYIFVSKLFLLYIVATELRRGVDVEYNHNQVLNWIWVSMNIIILLVIKSST